MKLITVLPILVPVLAQHVLPAAEEGSNTGWRGASAGLFLDERPPLQWHAGSVPGGKGDDVHWSPSGRPANIRFRVPMPSPQSSSPVVVGGLVITTADPDLVLAYDADDGTERWRVRVSMAGALPAAQREAWRQKFDEAYRIQGQPDMRGADDVASWFMRRGGNAAGGADGAGRPLRVLLPSAG